MKTETYKYFLCPFCRGRLSLKEALCVGNNVENGKLACASCNRNYPITNHIPRFSSDSRYSESFGLQWNRYGETQLDGYTGHNFSKERLFSVTKWPEKMKGEKILEVGSGAGRFTQVLVETEAEIFSFDCSKAVDANLKNNKYSGNLCLFQGDLYRSPLAYDLFDKVICLGVVQHTPDPKKAFMSITRFLRPGGELAMDIYKKTLFSLLQWKYILRPITKKIDKQKLLSAIEKIVPIILPLAVFFRKVGGSLGNRILPIANYSHLGISYELNRQWSILDTFDMYSPAYDHPQNIHEIKKWFEEAGFKDVDVRYGPNGIIGKGTKK